MREFIFYMGSYQTSEKTLEKARDEIKYYELQYIIQEDKNRNTYNFLTGKFSKNT